MHFSYVLVLAALSLDCAIAQPAHHRHHHNQRRVDYRNADVKNVDFTNPDLYNNPSAAPVDVSNVDFTNPELYKPHTTTTVAPKSVVLTTSVAKPSVSTTIPPKAADVKSTSKVPTSETSATAVPVADPITNPKTGLFGGRTDPIVNGVINEYIGNVGIPYGSNMAKVPESEIDNCKYSIKFINDGGNAMSIILWNKSGKDGRPLSGMALAPNLKFPLGIGESQAVCFDENSQVAFARDCERNPLKGNIPDCTWGEADFGNISNGGHSGYDVSSIPNSAGNVENITITCPKGKTSSQKENLFTDVAQTNAGGALNPGPMPLKVIWQ